MDFKVAGTANGINALQMDIKLTGLTGDILGEALEQARQGRLFILDKMNEAISQPRGQMSPYAPKMVRIQIPVEKIGAVIGPGGRVIRAIIEETGASIDVADDGAVTIGSSEQAMLDLAQSRIDNLTRELVVGDILTGKVTRLTNFGAFIELLPGREGLLRNEDLGEMEGELDIDDELTVMVQEIDNLGRLNLSRRALFGDNGGGAPSPSPRPQAPRQPSFDRGGGGRSGPGGPPRGGGMGGGRGGPGGPRPGGGGGRSGPGGPPRGGGMGGGRGGPGGPRPGGGGGRSGPGGGRGGPGGPRPGGGGGRSGPGGPPRSGGGGMADRRFLGGSGGRGR
jgi:polyribonucleotide nucleotidyltransferase